MAAGAILTGRLTEFAGGTQRMEELELSRFEITGLLGTGADYEVRSAVDRETGQRLF